ncbi:transglycosylase domain-containing protein [Faunimonas sp. B44]|uniref:transglycosylase domain-containing protein n=1 Tax=Faunimonas sp. B44 TaxID=3461493 RepID=UPI00404518D8
MQDGAGNRPAGKRGNVQPLRPRRGGAANAPAAQGNAAKALPPIDRPSPNDQPEPEGQPALRLRRAEAAPEGDGSTAPGAVAGKDEAADAGPGPTPAVAEQEIIEPDAPAAPDPAAAVELHARPDLEFREAPARRPRRLLRTLVTSVLLLAVSGAGVVVWLLADLPHHVLSRQRVEPALFLAADGSQISPPSQTLSAADLPDRLIGAVLAGMSEWNPEAGTGPTWLEALKASLGRGSPPASRMADVLAQSAFDKPEYGIRRNLQTLLLPAALRWRLDEREMAARYLNTAYFGAGAVGIAAAAEAYFGKPVADLGLHETAFLAGLLTAPSGFDPVAEPDAARARIRAVLDRMAGTGLIERGAADAAAAEPVEFAGPSPGRHRWFLDWAAQRAAQRFGPALAELRLETTLRPDLQALAERAITEGLAAAGAEERVGQAALVAMTYDGAVVAMVGGRSADAAGPNRAVALRREAGSTFALPVYLAALRAGWSPADRILDAPLRVEEWVPGDERRSIVDLRTAFALALPNPTMRLAGEIGMGNVVTTARDLGFDLPFDAPPTAALGFAETDLLTLTGAFASVAAGRAPVEPYGLAAATRGGAPIGSVRLRQSVYARSLPESTAMMDLLQAVVNEGTGQRARLPTRIAAGKTGTSRDYRDAWFVGFADDLVAGVWVGNDDGTPMNGMTGGELPAAIWRSFMARALGLEDVTPIDSIPDDAERDVPVGALRPPVARQGGGPGEGMPDGAPGAMMADPAVQALGFEPVPEPGDPATAPAAGGRAPAERRGEAPRASTREMPGGAWQTGTGNRARPSGARTARPPERR